MYKIFYEIFINESINFRDFFFIFWGFSNIKIIYSLSKFKNNYQLLIAVIGATRWAAWTAAVTFTTWWWTWRFTAGWRRRAAAATTRWSVTSSSSSFLALVVFLLSFLSFFDFLLLFTFLVWLWNHQQSSLFVEFEEFVGGIFLSSLFRSSIVCNALLQCRHEETFIHSSFWNRHGSEGFSFHSIYRDFSFKLFKCFPKNVNKQSESSDL